jgi:hypothetical protein
LQTLLRSAGHADIATIQAFGVIDIYAEAFHGWDHAQTRGKFEPTGQNLVPPQAGSNRAP